MSGTLQRRWGKSVAHHNCVVVTIPHQGGCHLHIFKLNPEQKQYNCNECKPKPKYTFNKMHFLLGWVLLLQVTIRCNDNGAMDFAAFYDQNKWTNRSEWALFTDLPTSSPFPCLKLLYDNIGFGFHVVVWDFFCLWFFSFSFQSPDPAPAHIPSHAALTWTGRCWRHICWCWPCTCPRERGQDSRGTWCMCCPPSQCRRTLRR